MVRWVRRLAALLFVVAQLEHGLLCVQAAGQVGAGGGNHPVSFLRLAAASERAAVHLLQEQPALLHRHGNHAFLVHQSTDHFN